MPHRHIPRSYDEISRHTVLNPDGSFRPTIEQEAEAIEHRHVLEAERDLHARIKEALLLARDVLMNGVFIEVEGSRVKLSGRVRGQRSLQRVEDFVAGIEGVTRVVNRLVVADD